MSVYPTPKMNGRPRRRNGVAVPEATSPEPGIVAKGEVSIDRAGRPAVRVMAKVESGEELDLSRTIVAAIAHALWQARGQDHLTNWLDAEKVLHQITGAKSSEPPAAQAPRAGRAASTRIPPVADDDLMPAMMARPRSRRL